MEAYKSPAISDAAPVASVDGALLSYSTSKSAFPHGRVETNFATLLTLKQKRSKKNKCFAKL